MSLRRPSKALVVIMGIVLLQAGLIVLYRVVARQRSGGGSTTFASEMLDGTRLAPELELVKVDGSRLSLGDLRGRPVLLHFWATWCPPCREELPGLIQAARRFEGDDLVLLAVAMDDGWAAVTGFFPEGTPAEVVRPVTPGASRLYEVFSLPDTYLISREGRLIRRYGGAREWRGAPAAAHLEQVLRNH